MKKRRNKEDSKKRFEITDAGKARAESPEFEKELRSFAKEMGKTVGPMVGVTLASFRIALALTEREDHPPATKKELSEFLEFMDEHTAEINGVGLTFITQFLLRHAVTGPVN